MRSAAIAMCPNNDSKLKRPGKCHYSLCDATQAPPRAALGMLEILDFLQILAPLR
jgi:hypothetical protein